MQDEDLKAITDCSVKTQKWSKKQMKQQELLENKIENIYFSALCHCINSWLASSRNPSTVWSFCFEKNKVEMK